MLSKLDEYRNAVINIISKEKQIHQLDKAIESDREKIMNIIKKNTEDRINILSKVVDESEIFRKRLMKAIKYLTSKNNAGEGDELKILSNQLNLMSVHDDLIIEKTKMEMEVEEEKQGLKNKREMAAIEQKLEYVNNYMINGMNLQQAISNLNIDNKVNIKNEDVAIVDDEFAKIGFMYLGEMMPNSDYYIKEKTIKRMFENIIKEYEENIHKNPIEMFNDYLNVSLSSVILDEISMIDFEDDMIEFEKLFKVTGWKRPIIGDFGYDMETGVVNAPSSMVMSVVQAEIHDRMESLNERSAKISKISDKQKIDLFVLSNKKYIKRYGFDEEYTILEQKNLIMLSETLDNLTVMAKMEMNEMEEEVFEIEKFA